MSVKNLLDPILEQGIKNTNFFEGRLLSGEDLRDQHNANRQHDRYLGQAIGQGIINGLEVSLDDDHDGSDGKPPILTVKKGLAINAEGEVIGLPNDDIKLALSRSIEKPKIEVADFYACAGAPNHQHVPNGVGIYILVMSSTAGYKEKALKSGLGDDGVAKGCGSKYIQEGVQFRLQEVSSDMLIGLDGNSAETIEKLNDDLLNTNSPILKNNIPGMSMLRNMLAHLCFGSEKTLRLDFELLTSGLAEMQKQNYGFIDELLELDLMTKCDVPLALMYWTIDGVGFVDMWSVRRMLYKEKKTELSRVFLSERRLAESYAIYRQFQDHIDTLINKLVSPDLIKANNYFVYLPPAAILPLQNSSSSKGIDSELFFNDMTVRGSVMTQMTRIQSMILDSFNYLPVKISLNELVWIYEMQENQSGYINGIVSSQRYAFISTGYMPFYGHAQFNLARWDFANYEPAIKCI